MLVMHRHNMQAQMDYLKYQINPHFFMNTLNNIHAMIDFDSQTAKRCVIELSKMMRYVLYDTDSDRTTLDKEIQFVGNYIELMRDTLCRRCRHTFRTPPLRRWLAGWSCRRCCLSSSSRMPSSTA